MVVIRNLTQFYVKFLIFNIHTIHIHDHIHDTNKSLESTLEIVPFQVVK